ncbi:MAG TPA: alkaline phosphatase [Fimbriimonas sp.]
MHTVLAAVLALAAPEAEVSAKNVILMIADGTGPNSYAAAAMYEGRLGREVFDGPAWQKLMVSTYPLASSGKPRLTGVQDPNVVYDPAKAWANDGYAWLKSTPTDSAAAATAFATGQKTYNGAISWSDMDQPMTNLGQLFHQAGKSTGVVTTVSWSDATPAAMLAHSPGRGNRESIAREMVERSGATVIMGAGHPWYDSSGRRRERMGDAGAVGNRPYFTTPIETYGYTRLIEKRADFEALAAGRLDMKGRRQLVGTVQAGGATQHERQTRDWNGDGKVDGQDTKAMPPYGDPLNRNVPTLATMAKGALNLLSRNPKGFFLMVEGGAVDHANHGNEPGRAIEETLDFFRAVEAANRWVEQNGGWKKNLLIVTADHETGGVWGEGSDNDPFAPVVDRGRGKLPRIGFNTGGHTNSLVPLYARGAGAELFAGYASRTDPKRGRYLDNTDVFKVASRSAE